MKKSKAFTLIELIAVLVILAILALIVTPLVLNIIKKARTSADKRSIDAYGRSIELAVADYLLDKGEFPTSIEQLTIEYIGDEVVCTTTQLKDDGSVYLAECTVVGRNVAGYTYGKEEAAPTYTAYSIGDEVTYNNVDYRVIKDSATTESTVTLLKAEPLTYEEVQAYSAGTGVEINNYNGYGGMVYYSSSTCKAYTDTSGCVNDYLNSNIKKIVDKWTNDNVEDLYLKQSRLIDVAEIETESKEMDCCGGCGACVYQADVAIQNWIYNNNYDYWAMTKKDLINVRRVSNNGVIGFSEVTQYGTIRPVVELYKSALN